MRVLLIGYSHGSGGIQTHTRHLAEGLAGRGHAVLVLSPPPRRDAPAAPAPGQALPYALETYRSLAGAVGAARRARPDVVVVAGVGFKAMLAALAAPRAKRAFFEVMSGARSGGAGDPRRLVHLGFHAVVGQGRAVARRFAAEFGWRGPLAVIPALPEPLERTGALAPRVAAPLGGRGARCAYFGRLAAHKNVALLIERWDEIGAGGASLDVWGTGPEADALAAAIAGKGLGGRIRLCGRYGEGEAYISLLRSYDLTLLPTVGDEGAPIVLLESMAAGVPFVANGVGGIGDYANPDCEITDGDIAGFVPATRRMLARLAAGDVDAGRLQRHYLDTFAFARLVPRWEAFLAALDAGAAPLPGGAGGAADAGRGASAPRPQG